MCSSHHIEILSGLDGSPCQLVALSIILIDAQWVTQGTWVFEFCSDTKGWLLKPSGAVQ